ncbi:MAG: 4Fe-4S dicluster domain-containing protein [Anaerolineales bacterium]|nr:4Fe-4S dicluster domain-containing protein [Anaerolineales bacterium]
MQVDQIHFLSTLSATIGVLLFVLMFGAAIVSLKEHEFRAAGRIALLGVLLALPYLVAGFIPFPNHEIAAILLLITGALAVAIFLVPVGQKHITEDDTPKIRVDERDIMFARAHLTPGSERYEEYYRRKPDKKALDDKFRSRPGLLTKGSTYFDPILFSAAEASFEAVGSFQATLEQEPAPERVHTETERITEFIKHWGRKLGAMSVGVTELRDYHLYSHIGRNEPYGQPFDLDHKFAIALTVEMDKHMLDHAPYGPTVMESAQQYLASGAIAVQIAAFIRNLGYPARAHIDGNYRVVCPLVARDAGLGEIGRMGLLMTPELGPRVRLAVVTTDLPLTVDQRTRDYSVLDFCARCKKCAVVCPSKSISFDDRTEIDGVKRWQINAESCFTYWNTTGTDCGRCVRVCPYSHADNLLHNVVRFGIRNSSLFRGLAVTMDDVLYGKKPPPLDLPGWMDVDAGGN